ncbi:hypothetical protein [Arcticibacter sp.]|uniref:hypothetical protein n=1 Tax=Arcticibacter sp. TaxID=1872630 RepID=UPI00388D3568
MILSKYLTAVLIIFCCSKVISQQLSYKEARLVVVGIGTQNKGIAFIYNGNTYTGPTKHPVTLIKDSVHLNSYYSTVKQEGKLIICKATIKTEAGSVFDVTDKYSSDSLGFRLDREIKVAKDNPADLWFNSFFTLRTAVKSELDDFEFFAPGIWYKDNNYLSSNALASDYSHHYFYFREDRLPLPVVMRRNKVSGATVTLIHSNAFPRTFNKDFGLSRIVDERMQFGALGFSQLNEKNAITFMFPGSEGEKTYISARRIHGRENKQWALRSHPVKKVVSHRYQLIVRFSNSKTYPQAVSEAWRTAYKAYDPIIHKENMQHVYQEEIKLLNDYWRNINGAPGWPFSIYIPNGNVRAYNYQMGFIGFQLPNAYYLLRSGLENGNAEMIKKASLVVDFWVNNSLTAQGLPKPWVTPNIDQPAEWRKYPSYMRISGDGMEGALNAWSIMKKHGIDKPEWLEYCENFGEWLVKNQNPDGSFYLAYDWWDKAKISNDNKHTSTNVIRYLLALYKVTRKTQYLNAALKAGDFSYDFIHDDYLYVAGVIDNPRVKDRESGQQALYAFLSLYDVTADQKWLNAATQAAYYTETFIYAYNVPMAEGDSLTDFPSQKSTTGQTLIATGHSGVDNGISFSSFQYYRLYLLTGDRHLLDISKMLMYNTLQTMDLDGKMGYKYAALQTEAFSLVGGTRGHSVRQWLAWNTAAVLDPLLRFKDAFNEFDIEKLEKLPIEERLNMSRAYAKSFGLSQQTEAADGKN